MARYIDVELLIKNIVKIKDLRTLSTKTIGEAVSNTPTADVAEVKRGKWIDRFPHLHSVKCSICSKTAMTESKYGLKYQKKL